MKHTSLKMVLCYGILLLLLVSTVHFLNEPTYKRAATSQEQAEYAKQDSAILELHTAKPKAVIQ